MPPPRPSVKVPELPLLLARAGLRTAFFYSDDSTYAHTSDYLREAGVQTVRDTHTTNCPTKLVALNGLILANADRCTFTDLEQWVDAHGQKPFFAVLWTFQAHYPYFSHLPRTHAIDAKTVPLQRARAEMNRYLNAISEDDALIGALVEHLRRTGRAKDTMIVVTGDHGQAFGQHRGYGNGLSVNEESVRIPLILIGSGIKNGGYVDRITGHIDIAPTVMDLLGLPVPPSWDGESLFGPSRRGAIYFANVSAGPVIGARLGDRKIIAEFLTGDVHAYDLATDPGELRDLAGRMPHRVLTHHRSWLAAWAKRTNRDWGM
jgi:arylsulfatase A-like enzyme